MSLEHLETQLLESLSPESRRIARKLLGLLEEKLETHPRSRLEGSENSMRPCLSSDSLESFHAEIYTRFENNLQRQTQKNAAPKEKKHMVDMAVRKVQSRKKRLEFKEKSSKWNGVTILLLR
jgi:hypothetical protein